MFCCSRLCSVALSQNPNNPLTIPCLLLLLPLGQWGRAEQRLQGSKAVAALKPLCMLVPPEPETGGAHAPHPPTQAKQPFPAPACLPKLVPDSCAFAGSAPRCKLQHPQIDPLQSVKQLMWVMAHSWMQAESWAPYIFSFRTLVFSLCLFFPLRNWISKLLFLRSSTFRITVISTVR